jgi:putative transposase
MRFCGSTFGQVLEPISRRQFDAIVVRHDGNAYDKCFESWDHLTILIFAQLSGIAGLRDLEASWNANAHHHYHLRTGRIARSTLSDANRRRPPAVFCAVFEALTRQCDRKVRREGEAVLRLIDATPVPLGAAIGWGKSNGRIRGLKLHVVYDPVCDMPAYIEITDANVNDVTMGEQFPVEAGMTYVFDKAYCKYPWWTAIHDAGAFFVTRQKISARFRSTLKRKLRHPIGDGFRIVDDCEVELVSKGDTKLDIPLRRIRLRRDDGEKITLLTNDMDRSPVEIAAFYKARWQIELLFRWIKQHLHIKTFLGRNPNAVRLQIVAAMIAYILLRIARRKYVSKLPIIRFAALLAQRLFWRIHLNNIDKPPEPHPSKPLPKPPLNQLRFAYP